MTLEIQDMIWQKQQVPKAGIGYEWIIECCKKHIFLAPLQRLGSNQHHVLLLLWPEGESDQTTGAVSVDVVHFLKPYGVDRC